MSEWQELSPNKIHKDIDQAIRLFEIIAQNKHPADLSDKLWRVALMNLEMILFPPHIYCDPTEGK